MCGALEAKFSLLVPYTIYTELANLLAKLSMERERFLWPTDMPHPWGSGEITMFRLLTCGRVMCSSERTSSVLLICRWFFLNNTDSSGGAEWH